LHVYGRRASACLNLINSDRSLRKRAPKCRKRAPILPSLRNRSANRWKTFTSNPMARWRRLSLRISAERSWRAGRGTATGALSIGTSDQEADAAAQDSEEDKRITHLNRRPKRMDLQKLRPRRGTHRRRVASHRPQRMTPPRQKTIHRLNSAERTFHAKRLHNEGAFAL